MVSHEDLKRGLKVTGILPNQSVTIVDVKWHGSTAVELFYERDDGQPGNHLLTKKRKATHKLTPTVSQIVKISH